MRNTEIPYLIKNSTKQLHVNILKSYPHLEFGIKFNQNSPFDKLDKLVKLVDVFSSHSQVPPDVSGSGSNLQAAVTSSDVDVEPAAESATCRAAAVAVEELPCP